MSSINTHCIVFNNIKSTAHLTVSPYLPEITDGLGIDNVPALNTTRHFRRSSALLQLMPVQYPVNTRSLFVGRSVDWCHAFGREKGSF